MCGATDDCLQLSEAGGETWSLYVAGDCVHDEPPTPSMIGESLGDRVASNDVSILNLEAPIPADDSIPKAGPRKESHPDVPAALADAGFDTVALANNHTMDYGLNGLTGTVDACEAAGLDTVGVGTDITDALAPQYLTVDGTDVAIVNACEREFGVATESRPGTAWIGHPDAPRVVERASDRADAVILVAHGGVEFVPLPPIQWQRRLRRLSEVGADLVVAHHPHVPQGWERYEGTPIFYSLGNFLFNHTSRPKAGWGLSLEVSFDGPTPASATLLVTEETDDGVDLLDDGSRREERLAHLHRLSELMADPDEYAAHWQELAVRIFNQRYAGWLRRAAGGNPVTLVRQPREHLTQDGLWDGDARQDELLTLLNVIRNSSHRSVMETALAVETGTVPDRRTPEVERRVRELLSWTEDQAVYDRPSLLERTASDLFDRFSDR
ncbi:CapA family protein [Halalkalicoccus sp. NIPERK01]|uniref:CapA family protein n=1 Tax=Halalkalicoccus sp. NIPERK01 TaxID=3053469 RepID=UPI00256ED2B3|nr:CapA family protein [Halalkalicoccus sp. NIPERK01]MDL5363595.1 CapA family protein [Halalkalicoccus sp. NIPERK01]